MDKEQLSILQENQSLEALWGLPLQAAGCSNCHQSHLVTADQIGSICPHCAIGKLEAQPARLRLEPPELMLPYSVRKEALNESLQKFSKAVWIRPDDLKGETLFQRLKPVYLPMWLVDSDVAGNWEAEIGFNYDTKSSRESFQHGEWHTTPVIETRINWEKRIGQLARKYNNVAVEAMTNHKTIAQKIGGFKLNRPIAYDKNRTTNAAFLIPDQQPDVAWPQAKAAINRSAGKEAQKAANGDHIRNFAIQADYNETNWTQLLMPMYFTFYTDDDNQHHPVFINGQSGKIFGLRKASQKKGWKWTGIGLAVAGVMFFLSLLSFAIETALPGFAIVGVILTILAFSGGALSLIPVMWSWQWNRKQSRRKIYSK